MSPHIAADHLIFNEQLSNMLSLLQRTTLAVFPRNNTTVIPRVRLSLPIESLPADHDPKYISKETTTRVAAMTATVIGAILVLVVSALLFALRGYGVEFRYREGDEDMILRISLH